MKPLESEEADLDEGGMSRQYHGDSRDEVEEGEIVEEGEAPKRGGDRGGSFRLIGGNPG